ncbi:uncharacterized protein METZ01_LOCUS228304, partial [marine metagenome]
KSAYKAQMENQLSSGNTQCSGRRSMVKVTTVNT